MILAGFQTAKASHLLGGEITWECIKSGTDAGKFVFSVKLYRYCPGSTWLSVPNIANPLSSQGGPSTIPTTLLSTTDISPNCYNPALEMDCYVSSRWSNSIEERIYESAATHLVGVPPATGAVFSYSTCCRPPTSTMVNITGSGYWLRAIMYPYNNPVTGTPDTIGTTSTPTCYDSSPRFAERPATIICTNYKFTYNHNAVDDELDSLDYKWGVPMTSASNPVGWKPGYSVNNQLPTTFHNSKNIAATLNQFTGEITFTPFGPYGQHCTVIQVTAYKCGQKVAEIFRDIPVALLQCAPTPTTPPITNNPPVSVFKACAVCPPYVLPAGDTVLAGDSVEFIIKSTDFQFNPNITGAGLVPQENRLLPSGSQFGTKFSDPNAGCLYPPCATLDTNVTSYKSAENYWEDQFGVSTNFKWVTDCNHLAQVNQCFIRSSTYNFVFKVLDNFCPAPGADFQTFAVTVIAPPALPAPKLHCAQVQSNGDVFLSWDQPVTAAEDTTKSFRSYVLFRSDSAATGFTPLDTILNIATTTYLDAGANAHIKEKYYYIKGVSSCNDQGQRIESDTISAMKLNVTAIANGDSVSLDWNDYSPGGKFPTSTTGQYNIYRVYLGDTTFIKSATVSEDSFAVGLCYPALVDYYIEVEDTTTGWGCKSTSAWGGATVGDQRPPAQVVINTVSVDDFGARVITWPLGPGDVGQYYIYKAGTLIDSVPHPATSYNYVPAPGEACIQDFMVSAADTCGNTNPPQLTQDNMCLDIVDINRCSINKYIRLSWGLYSGWSGLDSQEVWVNKGAGWVMLDRVGPNATSYNDVTITAPVSYSYRIRSYELNTGRYADSDFDTLTVSKIIQGTIIDPPDLRCVSFLNDTTIRLEWIKPPNPDDNFDSYHIYHSTDGVSFNLLDSIKGVFRSDNKAYDSVGYTHQNAAAGVDHYYYVKSRSGCEGDDYSDPSINTLRAMRLSISQLSDSVNRLDWNPVVIPNAIHPSNPQYEIWRDPTLGGTFAERKREDYKHEFSEDTEVLCEQEMDYKVRYFDGNFCWSESNTVRALFKDVTPPAKQFLDSVSVRPTDSVAIIGWSDNPSSDVAGYYVLKCSGGSYELLDTIEVGNPLYYEDYDHEVEKGTSYAVVAYDQCGGDQLLTGDFNCHQIVHLTTEMDYCDQSILLNWTPYSDFVSGIDVRYKVMVSTNGSKYVEAGDSKELSYRFRGIVAGNNYCFYIRAIEKDGSGPFSSTSMSACVDAEFVDKPDYAYLQTVSVTDTNTIKMCLNVDTEADLGEYWIRRSLDSTKHFKVIATIPVPDPLSPTDNVFCYDDGDVDTEKHSYYYRIDVMDPCGDLGRASNLGRSVVLNVQADNKNNTNTLSWNKYFDWEGGIGSYRIYRGINGNRMVFVRSIPVQQIAELPEVTETSDQVTYVDNVANEVDGDGQFCYYVEVVEGTATAMNLPPATSKSNVVCTIQYPLFYVPTAFTPNQDGLNDIFRPEGVFHDATGYSMEVFNRWGERIFSTEDYEQGWDGTNSGAVVPNGAYVYKVKFTAADGQTYERTGTVTLTR